MPGFLSRAVAEPRSKAIRLGWITAGRLQGTAAFLDALKAGLADLGYLEGRHFTLDVRYADDDASRVAPLVEELIGRPIAILVAQGAVVFTISRMTLPVPVVYGCSGDPIAAGIAESLSKPLRNMTGQT